MQIQVGFAIACLKVTTKRNIYQFQNIFWNKKNGVAMGTSCTVDYSFLCTRILKMVEVLKNILTLDTFLSIVH